MTLKNRTEKLIRILKEMELARKLKNSSEKGKVIKSAEKRMEKQLEEFKLKAVRVFCGDNPYILDKKYKINPEDSLELVLLCIITRIEDYEMLEDWKALPRALFQVRGEMREIAEDIAFDLMEENMLFSDFTKEEFVEKFF